MNSRCCHPALACLLACVLFVSSHWPVNADEGWQKQVLHEKFFAEGASAGDINGDGHVDLVAGPLWFAGPDFQESKLLAEAREFSIFTYSDQFFSQVFDANGDQANDVLVLGFPGKSARLYLNPGHDALDSTWEMHDVASIVDNESPFIADLIPGGLPEIVCGREGQYGYYQAGPEPTTSWKWIPISRPGACGGRFTHSMGVGDVNGDGRLDVLDRTFWWEQPAESTTDVVWTKHQWAPVNYGGGGAQICVSDIDADGDNDIVTSYNAHGYGLGWFEQGEDGSFTQHRLMGTNSLENDYGVVFSQLHALAIRDVDDDGRPDIVTGKRYWAHQGHDPGGLRQPVLYWFRNLANPEAEGGVDFVPYEIDSDSGVGVDVLVTDLNADQRLDVVTCSKRGLMVHRQLPRDLLASTPDKWKVEEGRDQNQYADGFSPEEAAQRMLVPAGFEVDLLAAEPELTQPIAMCFDARGRIWVVEGHTYPQKAPEGEGRDRVVIFSDEDSDGSFETKKTFMEGLNLVSGIEVGFGGVWIGAAPELLFIPDRDQDDVPDAEPQVLLDGWGYEDTHETLNSFTWGPDGWLYGCHGVFTHSRVGKPGTPDAHREPLNAGVWRYHPVEHRFEVFAHGTSNPWGVDFNDQGDWFVTACVIPHLYHIQQGARYQRQAGQHFNAYTYNDIKTIADHSHFTGKIQEHAFWGSKPIAPLGTSMVGGGHAHCGLAIYNGESFPPQYRNSLLFHNLHGHRIVREKVEIEGSGYVGLHRPDFALSQDHKQIGVGVMVGPDGSLYCSDWHDVQTCHNRSPEIWDRTDGRLFRIRYGAVQPQQFDLWQESDLQLAGRLSGNGFFARAAQRVLHERAASGKLDLTVVVPKLDGLLAGGDQRLRLRALWTKFCIGALSELDLQNLLKDPDPYVRGWAVHFIGESYSTPQPITGVSFGEYDFRDPSPVVRRYLASILQRLPHDLRWKVLEGVTSFGTDARDPNIPALVWYGLEPLVESDPARAMKIAIKSTWPDLPRFVIRRSSASEAGREGLVASLASGELKPNVQILVLEELTNAAKARAGLRMPKRWPDAFQQLSVSEAARTRELALGLSVQFGDASAFPHLRGVVTNAKLSAFQRIEALNALVTAKDPELKELAISLLQDSALSQAAARALANFDDPEIAAQLLQHFDSFSNATQIAALSTLAARATSAEQLVESMETGKIPSASVPAFIVRQLIALDNKSLNARIEKTWGKISISDGELQPLYARYQKLLSARQLAAASAPRGRILYDQNCGNCHRLFGEGGTIGPDITGANRREVKYWLENILEPNALIGKAYQVTNFLTEDDRVVTGIVQSENEDAVTIQTATEKLVLAKSEIAERKLASVSLMPSGQLETLKGQQILDLFKYLMSEQQVSRPGAQSIAADLPANATIIEGELLQDVKVSGGTVRSQPMQSFGPFWTGDSHLWWTGGKPESKLSFSCPSPAPGKYDLLFQLTEAPDYAQVRLKVGGQAPVEVDLYDPKVVLAPVVRMNAVEVGKELVVEVEITGCNAKAAPSYMVGIDCLVFLPVE